MSMPSHMLSQQLRQAPPGGQVGLMKGQGPPNKGADTGAEQRLRVTDKPALLQLQDLASADAMTPPHKPLGSMTRPTANSPLGDAYPSSGKSSADGQTPRPPALAQLRALAGLQTAPRRCTR